MAARLVPERVRFVIEKREPFALTYSLASTPLGETLARRCWPGSVLLRPGCERVLGRAARARSGRRPGLIGTGQGARALPSASERAPPLDRRARSSSKPGARLRTGGGARMAAKSRSARFSSAPPSRRVPPSLSPPASLFESIPRTQDAGKLLLTPWRRCTFGQMWACFVLPEMGCVEATSGL